MTSTYDSAGLSQAAVAERIARGQYNQIESSGSGSLFDIFYNNIITLFNGVLSASAIALLIIHAYIDALFLITVTAANTLLGIIEELRAKWALDKLQILTQRKVTVIRDGREQLIEISGIVLDDYVVLRQGDPIVADGQLISNDYVTVDESLLTGEGEPVQKHSGDELLSGSFCSSGSGIYQVSRVGKDSHVNRLTEQAKAYKIIKTPLQQDINTIIRVLTMIMGLFVVLLLMESYIKKLSMLSSILSIATVIKSLVPEGLVLITTLAFALGAIRIAKKHVLVQKINAIESMSHVTTLCLDKTGTLGTNRLQWEALVPLSLSREAIIERLRLLTGAVRHQNPTMLAISAQFSGSTSQILDELPFSSVLKVSAVQVRTKHESPISLWLGAPDALTAQPLTTEQSDILQSLQKKGLRVLLFAQSTQPLPEKTEIQPIAFIVLRDELRPEVGKAIQFYESRGVKIKVLSGDHPETVSAIAKAIGIKKYGDHVNGNILDNLDEEDFKKTVNQGQFFGSLLPRHKQRIIQCLQELGEYVGMMGDGVNDVLALKKAQLGIAMNSGAAAARDVADIILLQNDFTHLPSLSQEGDKIIYNIKRMARLFLTKNIYCLFFILFVGYIGLEFPLSPRYITWIDFLTIGLPATLLTFMTPILKKQSTENFMVETVKFALAAGLIISIVSLLVYVNFSLFQDRTQLYGKTAGVIVIIFMSLYVIFCVTRAERKQPLTRLQPWVVWSIVVIAILAQILVIYCSFLRNIFGVVTLDADSWITIIFASSVGIGLLHLLLKKMKLNNDSQTTR